MSDPFNTIPNNGNPFAQYSAYSQNSLSLARQGISDLKESFNQPSPFIQKPCFQNKNNVLHNNLGETLILENIIPYNINIDSNDRNLDIFPNPFHYTVSFGGVGQTIQKDRNLICTSTSSPSIERRFKNVKYVKLSGIILSKYLIQRHIINHTIEIDLSNEKLRTLCIDHDKLNNRINSHGICMVCHHNCCLCNLTDRYKFIVLKIKELATNHIYATNSIASDNSFILILDKTLGNGHNTWIAPASSEVIYKTSSLSNINKLTFEFFDSFGCPLNGCIIVQYNLFIKGSSVPLSVYLFFGCTTPNLIDKIISSENCDLGRKICLEFKYGHVYNIDLWYYSVFNNIICQITDECIKKLLINNYECLKKSICGLDIFNLLKFGVSNNIFLTIGVVENELNTVVKFSE